MPEKTIETMNRADRESFLCHPSFLQRCGSFAAFAKLRIEIAERRGVLESKNPYAVY